MRAHALRMTGLQRRYEIGEQVFLCYGKHTNLELLGEGLRRQSS